MSAREKAACQDVLTWLKANLGAWALGSLTGTDQKALAAAVHILAIYAYGGDETAMLAAFRLVVMQMQPSTRYLAFHAIAHTLDWNDRARVWALAKLPAPELLRACEFEPTDAVGVA